MANFTRFNAAVQIATAGAGTEMVAARQSSHYIAALKVAHLCAANWGVCMSAYVIAEIEITDPDVYEDYKKSVAASLSAYGGKFLARAGACVALEGSWQPPRLVVIEFPSMARAKQWWASPEYSEPKSQRQRSANTRMIVVDGTT
jgi:uncharacterized protein (DUF1330 family)